MKTVLYTKFNKLRREEYRIMTMICEEDGSRFVEKKALNARAESQIQSIYENSLRIGEAYRQLDILIPEYKKDRVVFEYLQGENLESDLVNYIADPHFLTEKIKKGLNIITDIAEDYKTLFKVTDEYRDIFGEPWCKEGEPASMLTNIDVLFDNIIIKDDQYICLDCEWVFDFPIPVSFVKYRCLFYFYQKYEAYLKQWKDLNDFLEVFNISKSDKDVFMNMERNFQIYVTGKDFENDYVYKYEKNCQTINEAFVDRYVVETEISNLNLERDQLRCSLNNNLAVLEDCQRQLQGKFEHVKHLEGIVVEKSQREAELIQELALKEQHVKNLTSYIDSIHKSSWYRLSNAAGNAKKKLHKKKD